MNGERDYQMKFVPTIVSASCSNCNGKGYISYNPQCNYCVPEPSKPGAYAQVVCSLCSGKGKITSVVLAPEGWDGISPIELEVK